MTDDAGQFEDNEDNNSSSQFMENSNANKPKEFIIKKLQKNPSNT